MQSFFAQFGTISRLKLSRNKKTGKSKHYAFIEFENSSVAEIVADTMDRYVLFDHKLVCHIVAQDKIHERMFVGANRRFRPIPWRLIARNRHNAVKDAAGVKKLAKKNLKKDKKKRAMLEELEIEYDFKSRPARQQAKKIKFSD
jgi:nucleolar protein 15